ncbi:MAG: phosphoribosyl-ATP diphosphatase [Planctomycetota bacterium]|jgi:phosphoribosyl-ATP pyrophosphohydrolase/phosphoribosyl-AMP cyclohydrolase
MIVPSIDIMDGKAVQLRRGREHVLTAERDPHTLAREFNRFGEVAVIDLDAALGRGNNRGLIRRICRSAEVRVGGGIRNEEHGRDLLRAGASRIIVGTSADPNLLRAFPSDKIIVALDHVDERVLDRGWTRDTGENLFDRASRLAPFCGGFLCTFVKDEGGMEGMDPGSVLTMQERLERPVTVAGGIASTEEVIRYSRQDLDVQVGMALYTGEVDPVDAVVGAVDFEKSPLVPTVVQDECGQVLMLAYSSEASLRTALRTGKGVYFSRSKGEIWEKGKSSGCTQNLISCRVDCDRDALLFKVRQAGKACHKETYSCFGKARFSMHRLFEVLRERQASMPEHSYTASLFQDRRRLHRKLMEEAFEVTQARCREETVWEIADLLYFAGTFAVGEGVTWEEIEMELAGREKGGTPWSS